MSNEDAGWRGKKMKHADGRTGVIRRDYVGYGYVTITIRVDGSESEETIQLNSRGKDSGATGWSWMYAREGEPEVWALLGDHNPKESIDG